MIHNWPTIADQIITVAQQAKGSDEPIATVVADSSTEPPKKKRRARVVKKAVVDDDQENCPIQRSQLNYTDFNQVFKDNSKLSNSGKKHFEILLSYFLNNITI